MALDRKILGRSGLKLSVLGFGGTGLGNMYVPMTTGVPSGFSTGLRSGPMRGVPTSTRHMRHMPTEARRE